MSLTRKQRTAADRLLTEVAPGHTRLVVVFGADELAALNPVPFDDHFFNDSVLLTDSVTRTASLLRRPSETVSTSDSISLDKASGISLSDAVSLTDGVSFRYDRSPGDTVAVTDSPNVSSFNPSSLPLTLWLQAGANFSIGSNIAWLSSASSGTSGSHAMWHSGTGGVTNGSLLNGLQTANFSSTAVLQGRTHDLASLVFCDGFLSASAWSFWALVNLTSISGGSGSATDADIIGDGSGARANMLVGGAGNDKAEAQSNFSQIAQANVSTGVWTLIQARFSSTTLGVRVNGGSWSTVSSGGNIFIDNTQTFVMGVTGESASFVGDVADVGVSDTTLSDGDYDNVRSYINATYALSI